MDDTTVSRGEMIEHFERRDREIFNRFGKMEGRLEALDNSFVKHQLETARERGSTDEWRKSITAKIDGLIQSNAARFTKIEDFNAKLIWWIVAVSGTFSAAGYVLRWLSGDF